LLTPWQAGEGVKKSKTTGIRFRKSLITNGQILPPWAFCQFFRTFGGLPHYGMAAGSRYALRSAKCEISLVAAGQPGFA
jgi:hypothetical protein